MQYEGEASAQISGSSTRPSSTGPMTPSWRSACRSSRRGWQPGEPALVAVRTGERRRACGRRSAGSRTKSRWSRLTSGTGPQRGTRDKFAQWIADEAGDGRVRVLAEQPWAIGNEAQVRDWARHESVTNVAFAEHQGEFFCTYDAERLPPRRSWSTPGARIPTIAGPGGQRAQRGFEDPHEFCRRLDPAVERPEGEPTSSSPSTSRTCGGVRRHRHLDGRGGA